jgi:sugar-specific transcriptional regulator TrmB
MVWLSIETLNNSLQIISNFFWRNKTSEQNNLSLNRITRLLNALGFSSIEAKVYIYVAKLGPLSNEEIASQLDIKLMDLCQILEGLIKKGIIIPTIKNELSYTALPFEELIDNFIRTEIDQTEEVTKNHQQLISTWKSLTRVNEE